MDKNAKKAIDEFNRKIESLQEKRDAVIKKEKERKAKAQEKWKGTFMKEFIKGVATVFGADYEEDILPERLAAFLTEKMPAFTTWKGREKEAGSRAENENPPLAADAKPVTGGALVKEGGNDHE